jgi:hypothetical protein
MSAKSQYLDQKILNAVLRAVSAGTFPDPLWFALNTTASTPTAPGTEDVDANYSRQSSFFSGPTQGASVAQAWPNTALSFYGAGRAAGSATIVEVAIYDASTLGNELFYGAVGSPPTVGIGDTASITASPASSEFNVTQGGGQNSYLQLALLSAITRSNVTPNGIPFSTTVWCALNTTTSTPLVSGTEVVDSNYSRQAMAFSAPVGSSSANSGTVNFFGAGAAAGPYTIVEGALYDAPATISGAAVTITVTAGPTVTLTGLTGMTASFVGSPIAISGSSQGTNNGTFIIASFISSSSVTITNPAAVTDTGSDHWSVGNALYYGSLTTSKTVGVGDTLTFATSSFTVAES